MARCYIIGDNGVRAYFATQQLAERTAQRLANRLGRQVKVYHANPARGPRRKPKSGNQVKAAAARDYQAGVYLARTGMPHPGGISSERAFQVGQAKGKARDRFARNPDPMDLVDHQLRMMRERQAQGARATAAFREKYAHVFRPPGPARAAGGRGYLVKAAKGGKTQTHRIPSRAQAEKVADAYEANGYQVSVLAANPTKASTARRRAVNKKGCWVTWGSGAGRSHKRFANKGLATMYARRLADEYGVRNAKITTAPPAGGKQVTD